MPAIPPSYPAHLSPRRAKLRPPRLPGDMVLRLRLLAYLNRMAALTLVVAPAGYGKTTLVASWLAQLRMPTGWLSLDSENNEPLSFLAALIAAMDNILPGFGKDIATTLNAPNSSSWSALTVALINELDALTDEFVLVLDDYHYIREQAVHQLIIELVTYPPKAMHLVLTARHDPPLPWRTRVRVDLCEIRAADMGFTADEAMEFLTKAVARPIAGADARLLVEQSQGWVTSLRLAALSMRNQSANATWSGLTNVNFLNFNDYFSEEVLLDLEPELLNFLLQTSVLDLLSGPLCDFVVGGVRSEAAGADPGPRLPGGAVLRELERAGAFTVALDDQGAWYRYHPLLREVLRRKLAQAASAAEIASLYARAAAWHEENGFLDEALGYALTGGALDRAVALVQRHRHQLHDRLEWRRLTRWLQQFPASAFADYIELAVARAWLNYWRYNLSDNARELARLEQLTAALWTETPEGRQWRGEIMALRCQISASQGDAAGTLAAGEAALANVDRHNFYVRSAVLVLLMVACQMADQPQRAQAYLAKLAAEDWVPRDLIMARVLHARAFRDLAAGDLVSLRADSPKTMQVVTARDLRTTIAWTHYFWACACYHQNDLDCAREHFRAVLELAEHAHAIAYTHSAIGLALVEQALQFDEAAVATIENARRQLEEQQQYYMLTAVDAFAADLAARQGRVEEALRWVARERRAFVDDAFPTLYAPGLAFVRVLLAGGSEEQLREARVWLDRQAARAVQTHNILVQIEAQTLAAVLAAAEGDRPQAVQALAQALALAERGQAIRPFLDYAPQLAALFDEPALTEPAGEFAARVRTAVAFEQEASVRRHTASSVGRVEDFQPRAGGSFGSTGVDGQRISRQVAAVSADGPDLSTLLTYREMDVLRLLDQRLTNKEIAQKLGITTETVRQHTVNLFRKLNVDNRRQAVVVAHKLHFFDEPA